MRSAQIESNVVVAVESTMWYVDMNRAIDDSRERQTVTCISGTADDLSYITQTPNPTDPRLSVHHGERITPGANLIFTTYMPHDTVTASRGAQWRIR